jgi:hypothetical protein
MRDPRRAPERLDRQVGRPSRRRDRDSGRRNKYVDPRVKSVY